jgi:transcriptional regulator with XRE-family HTH domain
MQGRVALLQFVPISLKALKPKETDFEALTLGEHVKKRRLELNLTQKQAAERLWVTPWTVLNWEKGHTEPPIESMPAIIRFLGYDSFPEPKNIPERLLAKRRAMGWSIKEAARQFGVDAGTWGAWERGETILFREHRALLARLLELSAEGSIAK